jgi:ABC-type amino acid transport substrate-binding protein
MRALPTLALALLATAPLAACKRGDKTPLGSTDTMGARADTMVAPAALAPVPRNGGDTIAVPPAAIDTTTNRPAGQPSAPGAAGKAVGVDTPITRRMGSPAVKKP